MNWLKVSLRSGAFGREKEGEGWGKIGEPPVFLSFSRPNLPQTAATQAS